MNEYTLARGIGWLSVAVGTALVVAPKAAVSGFGMGERPRLGRFLGVKDLVSASESSPTAKSRPPGSWPAPSPTPRTPAS